MQDASELGAKRVRQKRIVSGAAKVTHRVQSDLFSVDCAIRGKSSHVASSPRLAWLVQSGPCTVRACEFRLSAQGSPRGLHDG